jgi:geranylgeranyl diphosphate synthase type II
MTDVTFQRRYESLRRMVDSRLATLVRKGEPRDLHDACRYILSGGGKRVRAVLVLLSCEAVGGRTRSALDAAAAIEVLHNFTLVHDDVMDNARARRGRPTVHVKWDLNTALLTGDVLLGIGYRTLLRERADDAERIVRLFTEGLLEVCEGQALDLAFEHRSDVTVLEYFRMIEKKTAALFSAAAEIGSLLGGGPARTQTALRRYGHCLGRAFQLQDDLLDVIADQENLGKPIGGDIVEGKRTFLLLRAADRAEGGDRAFLRRLLEAGRDAAPAFPRGGLQGDDDASRRGRLIAAVTALYERYGILTEAREEITRNTTRALRALMELRPSPSREMLRRLADMLLNRIS